MPKPQRDYNVDDNGQVQDLGVDTSNEVGGPGQTNPLAPPNYGSNGFSGSGEFGVGGLRGGYDIDPAFRTGLTDGTQPWRDMLNQPRGQYAGLDPAQEQARLQQQQVIQALQAQAAGSYNTQAQKQLTQGYQQAGAQQSSLASTMRGQSAGAAMRGAQQGQANIQRGFAGDQEMLKVQEQQAAQALMAQLLNQQRGQDASWAGGSADIANRQTGLNNAYSQFNTATGYGLDQGTRDVNLEMMRTLLGLDLDQRASDRNGLNQAVGAGASLAGAFYNQGGQNTNSGPNGTYNTDTITGLQGSNPDEWSNPYGS